MRKILLLLEAILVLNSFGLAQRSHLTRIFDFNGADFDYAVKGIVGANDSLYILSNTPDGRGVFFRIDGDGNGYSVIWKFDEVNYEPYSLLSDGNTIYGTTRFSANGGGALFKYSFADHSFEFIRDFNSADVVDVQVKQITGDKLWLCSQSSPVDNGSICTIKKDGTDFRKIYNDTNMEKGQDPADFVLHGDDIYIACYGGGELIPDGTGTFESSGCFIRIKANGTGYEKLVNGGEAGKGTQPQSLVIRGDKLIGLFANSGHQTPLGARFFRCNLDGTSYEPLGALEGRSLTQMLSTDSLIYGVSAFQVFGINPVSGEYRIFDELLSNPDFGYDIAANPAFLNGNIFMATQQGGFNGGGSILKWHNLAPEITNIVLPDTISVFTDAVLDSIFNDPEGDSLSYSFEYDTIAVEVHEKSRKITFMADQSKNVEVKITANDGWGGQRTSIQKIIATSNSGVKNPRLSGCQGIFPNPGNSVLYLGSSNAQLAEIYTPTGILIKSWKNPGNKIDVSSVNSGVYIVRYQTDGIFYSQKVIKY